MDQETNLKRIRSEISRLDQELLEILNRRAGLSLEVGSIKSQSKDNVFKPFREKEVLNGLAQKNPGPLPDEHLRSIYREILSSSRSLQQPQKVVYLGPEGTFSYFAGVEYLGHSARFTPKNSLEDVFRAVDTREAELGIIPLENSMQGSVGQSLDMFLKFEVFIHAEVFFRISHFLLSRETEMGAIKKIYSHPLALQQCSTWLRANLPGVEVIPDESTARAASRASTEPGTAAVGHQKLTKFYELNVLGNSIEDIPDNWTRFLVISAHPPEAGNREKTSLLFSVLDRPGSLVSALEVLSRKGINMRKLESRPLRAEKWRYVFFADVECDLTAGDYASVLKDLEDNCYYMRVLGSYPHGPQILA